MDSEWIRSSFCADKACVEVQRTELGVLVRNSMDQGNQPVVSFSAAEWTAFIQGAKAGEFG